LAQVPGRNIAETRAEAARFAEKILAAILAASESKAGLEFARATSRKSNGRETYPEKADHQ
jgi:hypothetical protein